MISGDDGFGKQVRWGTATVHSVATWMLPRMRRLQSPLAICSSMGLFKRWVHIGDNRFYTAIGESWNHEPETQCGWSSKTCVVWKGEKAVHYCVHADNVKILWIWFHRGPNLSPEVPTVTQIKRPCTGMIQLVLQEGKEGDVLAAEPKFCVVLCVERVNIYIWWMDNIWRERIPKKMNI